MLEIFLKKLNAKYGKDINGLHPSVIEGFRQYEWPGNIRELQNIVERAVILRKGLRIEAAELQLAAAHQSASANGLLEIPDEGLSLEAVEQELIKKAMLKANGNRSEAARLLRIPRHVLIYRLEKFKIL